MITEENGVFHIRTETYSYLFKINAYGLAEHLHFGTPVKTRDAGALSCRPGLGWGASILLDARIPPAARTSCRWNGAAAGGETTGNRRWSWRGRLRIFAIPAIKSMRAAFPWLVVSLRRTTHGKRWRSP